MKTKTYVYFYERERKQDNTFITYWANHKLDDKIKKIAYEKNIPVKNITFDTLMRDNHVYFIRELYESKI